MSFTRLVGALCRLHFALQFLKLRRQEVLRRPGPGVIVMGGMDASRRLRIALISPKGPLYRHRGGIWRKSLRYQPLTLTTLASLVPPELKAEIELIDEGIDEVDPSRLDADLIGMTVITGTATRAYELSAAFRQRGVLVVLGGPHVTLIPDDAAPHADSIVVGYAEDT
jgi:hypothetical protein